MSLVITYHSLAIECDSPSDLQRSPGVIVGREVCGKEGRGHGHWTAGRFGSILIISENLVLDLCLGASQRSTKPHLFGLLTFAL